MIQRIWNYCIANSERFKMMTINEPGYFLRHFIFGQTQHVTFAEAGASKMTGQPPGHLALRIFCRDSVSKSHTQGACGYLSVV
jgi:hypothetical protein